LVPKRAIIKYVLLHIAELILLIIALAVFNKFIKVPIWLMVVIISVWIAKDIALFQKVWKAYDSNHPSQMELLIGMDGIVMDQLDSVGYVKVKGELWKAEITDPRFPVKKGDKIKVNGVKGMKLTVERSNNN
jgi:membrane protein implicated in regulation of membrane protease activity